MKSKHIIIPVVILLISLLIAANQAIWIRNMYDMHLQELRDYANQVAEKAVLMEISERSEKMGGFSVYATNIRNPSDTGRFFTKKLRTADSTYYLKIDKHDPYIMDKVTQFVIKNDMPVNLNVLDSLFRMNLKSRYAIKNSYFDYIDLEKHITLKSSKPVTADNNYLSTDTITLDIQKSIAVVGYVESPNNTILQKMLFQLALTVLLIICSIVGLFYVSRSFVSQWKLEKLRQSSINAMTHEFKRPISGAVAMVSLIPFYIKNKDWQKVSDYAGNTLTELNKLTAYTERIQQISNNDKGNIVLNRVAIELVPFFEGLKARYSSTSNEARNISVDIRINTAKKQLNADLLHFSNVMDNLIENAIKYTEGNVAITVETADSGKGLEISIQDNGIGISDKELPLIFDKFYRSNRKETKNKFGFGLGLTYVKSIVEAHGGFITVQSKLNEGSVFTITWID
jgi:two-component system, OmpR family, phosphate regulon sensor histidine kinase PhoR